MRRLRSISSSMLGDKHVRRATARRLRKKIRAAIRGVARRRRAFPRVTWQPRPSGERVVQALQHGWSALLHLRTQERPLFRIGQHPDGSGATRMDRDVAADAREEWKICYFHHPGTRMPSVTGHPWTYECCWSRSSSSMVSTRCFPVTITPMRGSSRRAASSISCPARQDSSERATCGRRTRPPRTSTRTRASCSWRSRARRERHLPVRLPNRGRRRFRRAHEAGQGRRVRAGTGKPSGPQRAALKACCHEEGMTSDSTRDAAANHSGERAAGNTWRSRSGIETSRAAPSSRVAYFPRLSRFALEHLLLLPVGRRDRPGVGQHGARELLPIHLRDLVCRQ